MTAQRESTATTAERGGSKPTPPPASPRKYRRRLANLANVRTALADVVRKLETSELEPRRANALVYALATLAGIIQGTDLEQRIAALEERSKRP